MRSITQRNYNGPMRLFLPDRMGGPAGAASTTPLRTGFVSDGVFSTYVIPGDWPDDVTKWVQPGTHFSSSNANSVTFFAATNDANAGGKDTYAAMKEAFETATGPDHFILLAGWSHGLDFPLDGQAGSTASGNTMRDIWTQKVKVQKVQVRTLLARFGGVAVETADVVLSENAFPMLQGLVPGLKQNKAETDFINGLNASKANGSGGGSGGGTSGSGGGSGAGASAPDTGTSGGGTSGGGAPGGVASQTSGGGGQGASTAGETSGGTGLSSATPTPLADADSPASTGSAGTPPLALGAWDDSVRGVAGTHHQKILVVNGSEGLIAFFGGVDILGDRVMPNDTAADGSPQHDVHCRVIGDAAMDLLNLWIDRWNGCPAAAALEDATIWKSKARPLAPAPAGPGTPRQQVQIGQTVGNPNITQYGSDGFGMLVHCIRTTRKFIHMQDQYFWNVDAAKELNAAVKKDGFEHLTIIVPDPSISSPGPAGMLMRRQAVACLIDGLTDTQKQKIGIYCPSPAGAPGTYVHSKIWIFDDECAIVGSSNCNNRGYFSDSELMGRVSEATIRTFDDLDLSFAHKLRMVLWQKHLGRSAFQDALYDPSSVCYFRLAYPGIAVSDHTDDFGLWTSFTTFNDDGARADWLASHPLANYVGGQVPVTAAAIHRWVQRVLPGWPDAVDPYTLVDAVDPPL